MNSERGSEMGETKIEVVVHACQAAEAEKAIGKLVRKAARYGCGDVVVEKRTDVVKRRVNVGNAAEHEVEIAVVVFEVTGDAPRVPGFRLLARIERTAAGNFVDVVPGAEGEADPAWRTVGGRCDHCEKSRQRKLVFVVEHDDGRRMIVGRRCLRDYLGIDNPAKIMARFDLFRALAAAGSADLDEPGFGGSPAGYYALSLLTHTAAVIRLRGWTSKSAATKAQLTAEDRGFVSGVYPTSASVVFAMGRRPTGYGTEEAGREWDELNEIKAEDFETAKAALAWVRASTESSDYMHNLRVSLGSDFVPTRRAALALSGVAAYLRDQEKLAACKRVAKDAPAKVNAPSGRQTARATIKSTRTEDTGFGLTTKALYVFATPDGEWRAWGTVPAAVRYQADNLVGREIDLTATFAPKADDPSFAFASRPNGKLVE